MSRDKQTEIEKITDVLDKCTYDNELKDEMALMLYNAGYRKASDVAEEIFAEIGKLRPITKLVIKGLGEWDFDKYGEKFYWISETKIVELKKKCNISLPTEQTLKEQR